MVNESTVVYFNLFVNVCSGLCSMCLKISPDISLQKIHYTLNEKEGRGG